ncbi:MAG TPA: phage holin family protein [Microlunatus sp.]|nr:phage holin family protein [Microlunatus sp.]
MVRFLIRVVVFLVSAALGLLITSLLVPGFQVNAGGFVITVVVFAVLQSVLSPFLAKVAHRHARALLGGVGLLSTFAALLIAHFFTPGLQISGIGAWVMSTVLVWLVTALATWLLPFLFVTGKAEQRRSAD